MDGRQWVYTTALGLYVKLAARVKRRSITILHYCTVAVGHTAVRISMLHDECLKYGTVAECQGHSTRQMMCLGRQYTKVMNAMTQKFSEVKGEMTCSKWNKNYLWRKKA